MMTKFSGVVYVGFGLEGISEVPQTRSISFSRFVCFQFSVYAENIQRDIPRRPFSSSMNPIVVFMTIQNRRSPP